MCNNCRSDERELWAIGPPYPTWATVASGNFIQLVQCQECGQLWAEAFYEPYASFRYAVKWPGDVSLFNSIHSEDAGKTIGKWHEYQVRASWRTLPIQRPWILLINIIGAHQAM